MKTLNHLWRSLETIPGLLAIPAFWQAYCGPDIEVIRPHLRVTDMEGTLYPCPKPRSGQCPRKIVDHGDGEFVAICRDPYDSCERVQLTQPDVLLQQLEVASFAKMLAGPLNIRWQDPVARGNGAWGIGLSDRRDTRTHPVFLVLLPDTGRFVTILHRLLLNLSGPFVLVVPTSRHRTIEVQELMQRRGALFLSLEDHLALDDAGRLVAVDQQGASGSMRITPKEDRRRVVKEFTTRHRCTVRDIQVAAGVHPADYYKWLHGKSPDSYSTCLAIERILQIGLTSRQGQGRQSSEG